MHPELTAASAPILSCDQARDFEARLFAGDEAQEWAAMQAAGHAIAAGILRDAREIGGFAPGGRVLVLVGKGHNGGDALIAAARILSVHPGLRADVFFLFGPRALRPLAARAWQAAATGALAGRIATIATLAPDIRYELVIDGVFGFQFRPPVDPRVQATIEQVNAARIRMRAAVDLPSGGLFRADFTYATGAVKSPALEPAQAGRARYLDLGFFRDGRDDATAAGRVLTPGVLRSLAGLRPATVDKRSHGHLFVLGGSRSYPGAVLMATMAALRSGAGLVTACVPESLVAAYAARAPEAMWVGWPETPAGGLALEGLHLWRERSGRAGALLLGPGLTREAETLTLAREIVAAAGVPVVLDADALQPEIIAAAKSPLIVTPHAGEFARIGGGVALEEFARTSAATVVLKGPVTRITCRDSGAAGQPVTVYHSLFGGPVLARGGSGDLLAGIIGGLLAQDPAQPELAAARGVVWHGLAADRLAQSHGQVAVHTTQLLDHLGAALRDVEQPDRAPES